MNQQKRNDLCSCGSEKKFKKCCGSDSRENPQLTMPFSGSGSTDVGNLLRLAEQQISTNNHERAARLLQQVLTTSPGLAKAWFLLGLALAGQGKTREAATAYEEAIRHQPDYWEAMGNLAGLFFLAGDHAATIRWCRQALNHAPRECLYLQILGRSLFHLGQHEEAIASYRQALLINPDYLPAHEDLVLILLRLGQFSNAIAHCRKALEIDPNNAQVYCTLGNAQRSLGQFQEAIASFSHALNISSDYAEAHNDLGATLKDLGQPEKAISCYQRALEINPHFVMAHNNLGNAFYATNQITEAAASCRRAIELDPDYASAYSSLGLILKEWGDSDSALSCYDKAISLDPDNILAHHGLLFTLNYHPDKSAEEIFAAYQAFDRRFGLPAQAQWRPHTNNHDTNRRLKVAYLSPNFHSHSCQHFLEPLLAQHDPSAFEIYAYAELEIQDEVSLRYPSYVDHWIPTKGMSDQALADHIRAQEIDILVDLAGHTSGNRLPVFALKPAPVSLTWLGYGYTSGLSAIDYFLTDEINTPPGCDHLFAETPWRMAVPGFAFRPAVNMGEVSSLPAEQNGQITFGTLTRAIRINHRTIRVWSEILQRVPGARLVINSGSFHTAAMQDLIAQRFAQHGIGRERLSIGLTTPPWDVLRGIDIGLDCFPHNSGTTLFETLYMGVPYVTLADRPSVGRLGSAILTAVGHPEWIAQSEEEYIQIAVTLANDLASLDRLRANLRREMEFSPLMDEADFTNKIEDTYRQMFAVWVENQKPSSTANGAGNRPC